MVLERGHRRHEDVQRAVARLDAEGGADGSARGLEPRGGVIHGDGGSPESGREADGIGRAGHEHDGLGAGAQRIVRGQRREHCARVSMDHLGMVALARPGQ